RGGAGRDTFRLTAIANGADTIADFAAGVDRLQLVSPNFPGVSAAALPTILAINAQGTATSAATRLIYNTTTGQLSYDSNGSTAGGSTLLATLTTKPTLTASDFMVVAS
ncbi:MAG TPA: hypothetical protein VK196_00165, partial [Magnetospirillum sp.]|nr:hypothetical protein [Magnetospirillum sp.]